MQNIANQVAQLVVGWQIVNDGSVFDGQPPAGVIDIDITDGSATINGSRVELGIARHAHLWLLDEVERRGLSTGWCDALTVRLRYATDTPQALDGVRVSDAGMRKDPIGLRLRSEVVLRAAEGVFSGHSDNTQVSYRA
jgi:hypothetical protein